MKIKAIYSSVKDLKVLLINLRNLTFKKQHLEIYVKNRKWEKR